MRFNPHRKHSSAYYTAVLQVIVSGLLNGWSYASIRAALMGAGVKSPTNGEWTEASLNGIVARIRQRRGPFYMALLERHLAGVISTTDVAAVMRSH